MSEQSGIESSGSDMVAENGNDKLSIKVNIAERYYPLRISVKDEEKIRGAAKRINEKVLHYKQRYADRDIQDALSMATLQFVVRLFELEGQEIVSPHLTAELNQLDKELGDYLDTL